MKQGGRNESMEGGTQAWREVHKHGGRLKGVNVVTVRADFQQGMESVSYCTLKMKVLNQHLKSSVSDNTF